MFRDLVTIPKADEAHNDLRLAQTKNLFSKEYIIFYGGSDMFLIVTAVYWSRWEKRYFVKLND